MEVVMDMMESDRPIIKLDYIFNGCSALIDTGALFPVWTKNEKLLEALGAKLLKENIKFGGFGGEARGDLYELTIVLDKLMFPHMHIIACENENIPGFFIFSSTMFKSTIYMMDDIEKRFVVETKDNQVCRNLKITDENGDIHVLCTFDGNNKLQTEE